MREVSVTEGEEIFFTHYVEYIDMRLRRFFIKIIVMFTFLGLTCSVLGYYVVKISDDNKQALCAQKTTAQTQAKQTEEFIKDNPNGIPGISRAVLERSKTNAQRTVKSLESVDCE